MTEALTEREKFTECPLCETPLLNIISGAICPKGCGGIHPFVESEQHRVAERAYRSASLPFANTLFTVETSDEFQFVDVYQIRGKSADSNAMPPHPGLWRRVRITSSKAERTADREHVRAMFLGKSLEFARDKELEGWVLESLNAIAWDAPLMTLPSIMSAGQQLVAEQAREDKPTEKGETDE